MGIKHLMKQSQGRIYYLYTSVRLCGQNLVSRSTFFATEVVTGEPGHTFSRFDILDFRE